ncbi:MAG: hypothetical protein V7K49_16365 [Nostoc sp.]
MKKISMLTSFDLPRLRPSLREAAPTTSLRLNSARVAQLSITQLVERSRSVSQRSRNQRLW